MSTPNSPVGLSDVVRRYGAFSLGPISTAFPPGVTCILGENGAGKSTLLRLLAGLDTPHEGAVVRPAGTTMGYLPQQIRLPGRVRVVDYVTYCAWAQGVPSTLRAESVREALRRVDLEDSLTRRVRHLSGGMQQRLAIAGSAVHRPTLLLLDEPTTGLDLDQRLLAATALRTLGSSAAVLVTTHILDVVARTADRLLLLSGGTVRFHGSLADLEAAHDAGAAPSQMSGDEQRTLQLLMSLMTKGE